MSGGIQAAIPPPLPQLPKDHKLNDLLQSFRTLDSYERSTWVNFLEEDEADTLLTIFNRLLLNCQNLSRPLSSASSYHGSARGSVASASSRRISSNSIRSSYCSSMSSGSERSLIQTPSLRSSFSSASVFESTINEEDEDWQSLVDNSIQYGVARDIKPDIQTSEGSCDAVETECRCFCTSGICKDAGVDQASRSSHDRHIQHHWSSWYCPECLSPPKVQRWLSALRCHCAPNAYPAWYHLEIHRIQFENDQKFGQLAHELGKVLSKARFTRKGSLARHLQSAHKSRQVIANDCLVQIKKFAACGICEKGELFMDHKLEAAHLWQEHWIKGHDMEIWYTNRAFWKLISLRPAVWTAWQELLQRDKPGAVQFDVSWKHLQPPNLKILHYVLEGNFLTDAQIAQLAYNEAEIFCDMHVPRQTRRRSPPSTSFSSLAHFDFTQMDNTHAYGSNQSVSMSQNALHFQNLPQRQSSLPAEVREHDRSQHMPIKALPPLPEASEPVTIDTCAEMTQPEDPLGFGQIGLGILAADDASNDFVENIEQDAALADSPMDILNECSHDFSLNTGFTMPVMF